MYIKNKTNNVYKKFKKKIQKNFTVIDKCTISNINGEKFECGISNDSKFVYKESNHITLVTEVKSQLK